MQMFRNGLVFLLSLVFAFFLSACGGGGDSAPPPPPDLSPAATTLPASSITSNSAVLSAIVNPKGLSTVAYFEYSKDPALVTNVTGTSRTSPQAMGSGSTDNTISQAISGLEAGQTYYYRVTAVSSAGTKNGAIFTLSTLPLPTVTTSPATSITTTGAVLNGIVNPNGRQTYAWFEYGENPTPGTSIDNQLRGSGTDNVTLSTTLTTLNAATKYYFRVVATSSTGTSNGTVLDFTTAGGVPLVTTKTATSVTTSGGVLRGDVNSSGLATTAWFEYGTDNTFGSFAKTDNQAIAAGTSAVEITAPITGRSLGETIYYRVAASNIVGPSLKGEVFSFITLNPPPTANAGPDQAVYMAGPGITVGFLGNTTVTLAGSGSVDPEKTIASYLWEQTPGAPTVTLNNPASQTANFIAPDSLLYGQSADLQFKLTVTDNTSLTGTDNVLTTIKWGFLDDFSTDSTGTYSIFTSGTPPTFTYAATEKRARVLSGSGRGITFGKAFTIFKDPGTDVKLHSNTGVFSLVFYPTNSHGGVGRIAIRLGDTTDTYYELSTGSDQLVKFRSGNPVDSAPFTRTYSSAGTYPIKITFSPNVTTVEAFGGSATINTNHEIIPVSYFEIRADEQSGDFDNIQLEAAP